MSFKNFKPSYTNQYIFFNLLRFYLSLNFKGNVLGYSQLFTTTNTIAVSCVFQARNTYLRVKTYTGPYIAYTYKYLIMLASEDCFNVFWHTAKTRITLLKTQMKYSFTALEKWFITHLPPILINRLSKIYCGF